MGLGLYHKSLPRLLNSEDTFTVAHDILMLVHLCIALSREYVTLEHMLVQSLVACFELSGERFFADLQHGVL